MKIYINPTSNYYFPILYVLKIMEKNKNVKFIFLENEEYADLIWDHLNENSQVIASEFYDKVQNDKSGLNHEFIFKSQTTVLNNQGHKDVIATIFYLINCLQEFNLSSDFLDNYGRFKYEHSYQAKYNSIEENLVQKEIDLFFTLHNLKGIDNKSIFFISHDIDSIYGSIIEDGFWALKNLKINIVLKLIINEVLKRPDWKNIDKIININSEYDIRSTFFWLVNKGNGISGIKNADYRIEKEKNLLNLISKKGFTNGLHKSCSNMSIDSELNKGSIKEYFNRFHFLNFQTQKDWKKISESNLEFDSSLGFAERYGFRNSYGKSFQPFDIMNNKPFDFIETPLNFMDVTFHKYMKIQQNKIGDLIIDFIDKNQYNCDFAFLWHNNYFTNYKYKGFLEEYKKIIIYLNENKIETLNPRELVDQNKLTW